MQNWFQKDIILALVLVTWISLMTLIDIVIINILSWYIT